MTFHVYIFITVRKAQITNLSPQQIKFWQMCCLILLHWKLGCLENCCHHRAIDCVKSFTLITSRRFTKQTSTRIFWNCGSETNKSVQDKEKDQCLKKSTLNHMWTFMPFLNKILNCWVVWSSGVTNKTKILFKCLNILIIVFRIKFFKLKCIFTT